MSLLATKRQFEKRRNNQTILEQYYPANKQHTYFNIYIAAFNKAQFSFFCIPYICYYSNLLYHPFISFFLNHIYGHNLRMPAFYKFSFKLRKYMVRNRVRGGEQYRCYKCLSRKKKTKEKANAFFLLLFLFIFCIVSIDLGLFRASRSRQCL